ncbi:MAG: hypothetical protein RIC55_01525 [Pirellulaceae bacterium]
MPARAFTALLLAIFVFAFAPALHAADDALLGRGVQKLFEVGWDTSIKSREDAAQVAGKIDELFPGDMRGGYAYVLVLAKQRRYPDAVRRMKQILAAKDDDIDLWTTSIRLDMLTKDYVSALSGMDRMSELFPPATPEGQPRREEAVFLGRMIGYLQGPVESDVSADLVEAAKEKILARIGEPRATAFDQGRRRVREIFSALTLEKEDTLAAEKEAAEKEQQRLLADLAEEKNGLDPKRESLREDEKKLRDDAKQRLDDLAEDERPLLAQLNQIQTQALLVRRQLSAAVGNLNSAQLAMNNERDPVARSQIGFQVSNFNAIAARYDAQLTLLERRAFLINQQRAAMRRQLGQSQAAAASEIASIQKELGELDKREKRLDVQERKGSKTTPVIARSVRLLDVELAAFTTYDEFPLETEKLRVLDWFK